MSIMGIFRPSGLISCSETGSLQTAWVSVWTKTSSRDHQDATVHRRQTLRTRPHVFLSLTVPINNLVNEEMMSCKVHSGTIRNRRDI